MNKLHLPLLAKHDITMLHVGRRGKTLGEGTSHHDVSAERNKTNDLYAHKFTHKIASDINVTRNLTIDSW